MCWVVCGLMVGSRFVSFRMWSGDGIKFEELRKIDVDEYL